MRSGFVMLSVPTLWTAFVVNFLALGLIWAYVMRSYPAFAAARFWTGAAFAAAAGAALAMLRVVADSLLPLLAGGTVLIFAACLAAMGIKQFYGEPVKWRGTALITGLSFAGIAFFIFGYDSETDAGPGLLGRPVAAAGADAETADVAAGRPDQSRRPARRHRRDPHPRHLWRSRRLQPAACRRRVLLRRISTRRNRC